MKFRIDGGSMSVTSYAGLATATGRIGSMAKRARTKIEAAPKQSYFVADKPHMFVSSGSTVLDCSLGGGWVLGRMANIVGDKSTSKTALGCEALTNFARKYPEGKGAYRDVEAAFDIPYAEAMGLPIDRIDFGDEENPLVTVEDFYADLNAFIDVCVKADVPGFYVLDSLDALSDEAEQKSKFTDASYGGSKPKQIGKLFRMLKKKLQSSKVGLLIISQIRDNIGVRFGEKHTRTGGKAMDFYASHIVWLARTGTIKKAVNKIERIIGLQILANPKKNKVGGSERRQVTFDFIFGYGVDDTNSCLDYLKEVSYLKLIDITEKEFKTYCTELEKMNDADYKNEHKRIVKATKQAWKEVESTFLPKRRKYD